MRLILLCFLSAVTTLRAAQPFGPAVDAINSFGLDLLKRNPGSENVVISPYSIQTVLAMAYAGADGMTHEEMRNALHYPAKEAELHAAFADLNSRLVSSDERVPIYSSDKPKTYQLHVANRLFAQTGYKFNPTFVGLLATNYNAPFLPMDFIRNARGAVREINSWVTGETRDRIKDVISDGALTPETRLVLVNTIYFKAKWADEFSKEMTKPEPFHIKGGEEKPVATMVRKERYCYAKHPGFQVATLGYNFCGIQFVVILPEKVDGLAAVEKELTPQLFMTFTNLKSREVVMHLPKFKLELPTMELSKDLIGLGMASAFDLNKANFERMASSQSDGRLYASAVLHKTFINVDEEGTEAAGVTAWVSNGWGIHEPQEPIEFKVDRPFIFAIQDRETGACLFMGRVTEPKL